MTRADGVQRISTFYLFDVRSAPTLCAKPATLAIVASHIWLGMSAGSSTYALTLSLHGAHTDTRTPSTLARSPTKREFIYLHDMQANSEPAGRT